MKPIFWLRRRERASSRQAAHVFAVKQVLAAGVSLEQAGDVEERGLARARRTGDRNELAFAHVQVERAQRMGFDEFGAVDLGDGLHVQHGGLQAESGNQEWTRMKAGRSR